MSTTQGISGIEIGFGLAALLLSVLAGAVLLPALRRAMSDKPEGQGQGGQDPR